MNYGHGRAICEPECICQTVCMCEPYGLFFDNKKIGRKKMKETKEIHRLFERLCLKFNVPMPTFFLLDRKPQKTEFGFLHNSTSYFYQLPEDFEDPLGIIFY